MCRRRDQNRQTPDVESCSTSGAFLTFLVGKEGENPSFSLKIEKMGRSYTLRQILAGMLAIMQLRTGNPGGLLLSFAFSALFSTSMQFPLQKAAGRGRRAVPHRRPSVPIRQRRLLRRQICSCSAWDTSSSRKSGWAREISCSARCQEDSPFRLAIPYSVPT